MIIREKKRDYERSFAKMLLQCEKIEKLYERRLDAYIDNRFKQYGTSIDFYEEIIDNMSN